jgi:hypothetical protein
MSMGLKGQLGFSMFQGEHQKQIAFNAYSPAKVVESTPECKHMDLNPYSPEVVPLSPDTKPFCPGNHQDDASEDTRQIEF